MSASAASEPGSPAYRQSSATMSRCRRSLRIHALLEWLYAETPHGVDEKLFLETALAINLDDARHGFGHLALTNGRADHLTQCREPVDRATERDLVPLLAVLIHPED